MTAKRLRVTRSDDSSAGSATVDLNGTWAYNNEGKLASVSYPGDPNYSPVPPVYGYTYDGMGRLNTMTNSVNNLVSVNSTQYNAVGQMTQMAQMNYASTETRTYNPMGQLTNITALGLGTSLNITYNCTAGQNNGKIVSETDAVTGETVTYAYDSLNRLISAIGSASSLGNAWGQGSNTMSGAI